MFASSPRSTANAKIIPIIASRTRIVLSGNDPDYIFFQVGANWNPAYVDLPYEAPIGKRFVLRILGNVWINPSLGASGLLINVPLFDDNQNYGSMYTLGSGQSAEFIYTQNGWVSPIGGGILSSGGITTTYDIAIGGSSIASTNGVALGYSALGYTNGVAVGYNASGYSSGAAIGCNASGATNGASLGYSAIGPNNGVAVGYTASTNNKDKAVAIGYQSTAQRYRELSKSADGAVINKQSWSMVNWYGDTTDATPTGLLLGGTAAQYCALLNNSAFNFVIQIAAGVTGGGNTSGWVISGMIKRGAAAANTALVGVPVVQLVGQDSGASTWAVAVTADTTNGSLKLTVTGQAATTIRWNATATLSELRF